MRTLAPKTAILGLVASLLLATPNTAFACDKAEQLRLSEEARKLAQRNAWSGVERAYGGLLKTKCELTFDEHFLGAQAARFLGKTYEVHQRLTAAQALEAQDEIVESLSGIEAAYGRVEIKGDARRRPSLVRPAMPFAPDQRKSIEWAQEVVAGTGSFKGMLPAGEYEVGGQTFTVEAGPDWQVIQVGRVKGGGGGGGGDGESAPPLARSEGLINYANVVAMIGPSFLITPEPGSPVEGQGGLHQFAPHDVSATGMSLQVGGEAGLTYRAPEAGVAATLGYAGGYGNDTLHVFNGWLAAVVRPGAARIALGPSYSIITGKGTGVATWFDVGHNLERDRNDQLRYQGVSWGGGFQGAVGYGLLDLDKFQGAVELAGSWHTDGNRSFTGIGLRVGIIPTVPRFKG